MKSSSQEDQLTRLVMDPDFQELERQIAEFNILEALGVVRQELRHSDFLAFLLDPAEKHGMGDFFLKRFLQAVVRKAGTDRDMPVSPVELDVQSLQNTLVYREIHNIDVLLIDEGHHLAVIIENKIDTGEHSDQLARYYEAVHNHFPQCTRILGIYLTPEGGEPSLSEHYVAVPYTLLHDVMEEVIATRAATLGPDLLTILKHYAAMLRRHIMSESSIAQLCRLLYTRHKDALDLINEHRLDRQAVMRDELIALVEKLPSLKFENVDKKYVRFYPKVWETPELLVSQGATASGMILFFAFENLPEMITLQLWLSPGQQDVRERLFALAQQKQPPFKPSKRLIKWTLLWQDIVVPSSLYGEGQDKELMETLYSAWANFVSPYFNLLKTITQAVCDEFGIDSGTGVGEDQGNIAVGAEQVKLQP